MSLITAVSLWWLSGLWRVLFRVDLWGNVDKPLVRNTSQCRRTQLIVSLERGVCSCAELQVFPCPEAERKHVRRRARFQQHGDASCHQVFFRARQGAEGNSRHSDRNIRGTWTIVCHSQKTELSSLNVVIFPPVMRLVLDDPKQWPPRRLLIKFTS